MTRPPKPNISIDAGIDLKLGYLQLSHCKVEPSSAALRETYDVVASAARERFANATLAEHPVTAGVRRLFRSVGIDPSRYRPSGEALVRRITKGQGIHSINCIVDINNICSVESLFPLGTYDLECINGDITVRLGRNGEIYRGIGRELDISGKLVSADSNGAFGSPIADSERTKITEHTRELLLLLYAPISIEDNEIHRTLSRFTELAGAHAEAMPVKSGIHTTC